MKELLIMAKSLGGGGSEVALIELINALPEELYNITLALLTGTPCITILSKSPKVEGVYNEWLKDNNTSYVFYVHPDEIEAITREFAAIGNNLNQIAAFFNSGGIQSRAMHENINHAIACIFEMREQVAEMAGKNYGNLKAHRK